MTALSACHSEPFMGEESMDPYYGISCCWIPHQVGDDIFLGPEDDKKRECHASLDGAFHQIPAFAGMTVKGGMDDIVLWDARMTEERDSRSHFVQQE